MKKLIKKILTTACAFVLSIICLSGCSWLKIDNYEYYNQVVVEIGDQKFTKKNLIEAFNSYGYQYYQSYGYSMEESINSTIETMIDKWLLLEEIKSNSEYQLTDEEKLEIRQEAFDYMQDSIFTYEEQVRKEWNMTVESEDAETESTSLRVAEEVYIPSTEYDFETGTVTRVEEEHSHTIVNNNITLTTDFSKSLQVVTDKKVSDEAWARYVKSLQDSAESEGRSTKESEVLKFEQNRLIELLENNLYLEKYEHAFFEELPVDVDSVLDYYRSQYKSQKSIFTVNEDLYHTAMQKASTDYVYFHANSGEEYVNVKHILIKFNDAQTEAITALKTEFDILDDGTDEDEERKQNAEYKARLQKIVNQTSSTFELDGKTYTWNALVSNNGQYSVLEYVQSKVTASNLQERCAQFNELMYIFNDDEGSMNSEFDYVVNLDTNVADQMVKEFADGVRTLDAEEGEGSMDYVVTEYGVHIIFHAGRVNNLVQEKNIDNVSDEDLLRILCTNYTTPESNKSIFNYIYDTLALEENAYNTKSQGDINTIRTELKNAGVTITYYKSNYKDLYE